MKITPSPNVSGESSKIEVELTGRCAITLNQVEKFYSEAFITNASTVSAQFPLSFFFSVPLYSKESCWHVGVLMDGSPTE